MTLIKNVFKIFAVTALLSTANVFAADFLVDTTFADPDPGAGGWQYDIDSMAVSSVGDLVTVDIFTNFVDYNNMYDVNSGKIVFGDLLISTTGDLDNFDYAFKLSDADRKGNYYSAAAGSHWDKTGALVAIDNVITSKQYHGTNSNTASGDVLAGTTTAGTTGTASGWTIDRQNKNDGFDQISFSFNVGGIHDFQSASQIAFSWAMSCANDVVEGVANVTNPTTSVPEPATLLLVLIALGLMANSRKSKKQNFSA